MRIVFLGDSVTEGCFELFQQGNGYDTVREPNSGYVAILEKRLRQAFPAAELEIINAGVAGNSASDGLARLEKDVLSRSPDVVVVCFGLNSAVTPEEYAATMREIFQTLRSQSIPTIYMTPNMLSTYVPVDMPEYLRDAAEKCVARQINGNMDGRMLAGILAAQENGAEVCDAYGAWKRLASYGIDTTMLLSNRINHPTRGMHRLFADMLFPILAAKVEKSVGTAAPRER